MYGPNVKKLVMSKFTNSINKLECLSLFKPGLMFAVQTEAYQVKPLFVGYWPFQKTLD
jgi:hypothetical protein